MTKFTTLKGKSTIKTVFGYELCSLEEGVVETSEEPGDYGNVRFLGHDNSLGDVFMAWNDGEENLFTLFLGKKGDEFND